MAIMVPRMASPTKTAPRMATSQLIPRMAIMVPRMASPTKTVSPITSPLEVDVAEKHARIVRTN